ncbi:arylesterase [Kordiimonas sp.]|uniref:arylesterase n=1 Tax=Kordiimonas sp. TaxID=1970157 RepID=UPI003A905BF6
MMVNRQPLIKLFTALIALCAIFGTGSNKVQADEGTTAEIVAFGDSLTAGYGLAPGEGFTDQLQAWLDENSARKVRVINAGVSGDTSSGGRARLDWGLAPVKDGKPDLVILELGANDGLRGIDPNITAENIDAMVAELAARDVTVLVAGMMAPPNLGAEYAQVFNPIFKDVADKYDMPLYPFFLEGVAADASLNQSDGMHPNAQGVKIMVSKIGPVVKKLLAE